MNDTNETLVMPGEGLKALGIEIKGDKAYGKVGGYLVVFGDENQTDLAGDWFTKNTYFGPRDGDGAEALFHHALPIKGFEDKRDHRFQAWKTKKDDYGIFAETVLDMADNYERVVYGTVAANKQGLSSGSMPHLVRRAGNKDAGEITIWPIGEGSITPSPCEPRARIQNLKALVDLPDGVFDVPEAVAAEIDRLRYMRDDNENVAIAALEKVALQRRLISLQISALSMLDSI